MWHVTGGAMISRERKKDRQRQPWRPAGRPVSTGAQARWACTRVHEARYSRGITISLGEFEFARVEITLSAAGTDRVLLVEQMRDVAAEYLAREEALITGVPRENQAYGPVAALRRVVGIGYGMTLRGEGKRETVKFDVHCTEPIDDGASVGDALERVRAWIEMRAREEKAAVQGDRPDEGI